MSKRDLTGQRFGRWVVLREGTTRKNKRNENLYYWVCKCDCGTEREIGEHSLIYGQSSSCGCLRRERIAASRFEDLTDNKYGRLTVTHRAESVRDPSGKLVTRWFCDCDCGTKDYIVRSPSLKSGATISCGCYSKENNAKRLSKLRKKYNKYDLSGEYGVGYTDKGEQFYFDKKDYDLIKNHCWHIKKDVGYVMTNIDRKLVRMHRFILGLTNKDDVDVDHINHNENDNRRCNLRITTHSNNNKNTKLNCKNTSGYTGVCYEKRRQRWFAQIVVDGHNKYLGSSKNKEDAIKLRKAAEEKYFGEYSYDNSMCVAEQIKV